MKTQNIAGVDVTLVSGIRYVASMPIFRNASVPVTISKKGDWGDKPVLSITLNWDTAKEFINEFNNETVSFSGRVW